MLVGHPIGSDEFVYRTIDVKSREIIIRFDKTVAMGTSSFKLKYGSHSRIYNLPATRLHVMEK